MSKDLDQAFITAFDSEVKHAYQGGGKLRDTVTVRNNVNGSSFQFQKMGDMVMQDHSPQTDITPADVSHSNQTATLSDKIVGDYTDRFDDDKAKINERQEIAMAIGKAMGRQEDQTIYDTIDGGSFSGDQLVEETVGANEAMNTEKIRNAKHHFDKIEAPDSDRHFVMTPTALRQLLGTTAPTSSDFNTIRALVNGEINTWLGFDFHILSPNRSEGGITVDGSNIASNYAYHKPSVGLAIGTGPETDVDWVAEKSSWLSQGRLSLGGVLRDTEGQVEVQSDESVNVNQGTDA